MDDVVVRMHKRQARVLRGTTWLLHTISQKRIPILSELLSLAIVLELRGQNSFDVFCIRCEDDAGTYASLKGVVSRQTIVLEHGQPHVIRLVLQGSGDSMVGYIDTVWEIVLSDWRTSAQPADSRINIERLGDIVKEEETNKADDEVRCGEIPGVEQSHGGQCPEGYCEAPGDVGSDMYQAAFTCRTAKTTQ